MAKERRQTIIDTVQWVLIGGLILLTGYVYYHKKDLDEYTETYKNEQVYAKIYESQELETLKKRNKELHDSIKHLANAESAVEIRYVYRYNTDTITVERFTQPKDSLFHYVSDNDTIRSEITVKAADLDWVAASIELHNKFTIINAENDNHNYMEIVHDKGYTIEGVDAWHRVKKPNKWYENIKFGPQVGVGYGIIGGGFDVYAGVGFSYTF